MIFFRRRRKSLYGDLFIVDDDDVKKYMEQIYGPKSSYKQVTNSVISAVILKAYEKS